MGSRRTVLISLSGCLDHVHPLAVGDREARSPHLSVLPSFKVKVD